MGCLPSSVFGPASHPVVVGMFQNGWPPRYLSVTKTLGSDPVVAGDSSVMLRFAAPAKQPDPRRRCSGYPNFRGLGRLWRCALGRPSEELGFHILGFLPKDADLQ